MSAEGYAAAFIEVAKTEGVTAVVGNELATFSQAFESSRGTADHLDRRQPSR